MFPFPLLSSSLPDGDGEDVLEHLSWVTLLFECGTHFLDSCCALYPHQLLSVDHSLACSGSTVWRPRAGTVRPVAHLILMLRELSQVSVLQLRKWIIELFVLRATCTHTFHRELLSVYCVLNSGFSLALVDESDRPPGFKELRI